MIKYKATNINFLKMPTGMWTGNFLLIFCPGLLSDLKIFYVENRTHDDLRWLTSWWRPSLPIVCAVCDVTGEVNAHWSPPYSRSCSCRGRGDIFTGFTYSTWCFGFWFITGTSSSPSILSFFPFDRSENKTCKLDFILDLSLDNNCQQKWNSTTAIVSSTKKTDNIYRKRK